MEYHLYNNSASPSSKSIPSVRNVLKKFVPIFALAAILPVLLFAAGNTVDYDFTSSANTDPVLRIWFEPSSVVLSTGESITLEMVADMEGENDQVHTISAKLPNVNGIRLNTTEVKHVPPFRGKTTLGEILVTAISPGKYELNVPPATVTTSINDLSIITSPATIIISN